jgi:hypothetical protein
MTPNEELQPTARKIEQASAHEAESIPLNQPFPEELEQPQPSESAPEPEKEAEKHGKPVKEAKDSEREDDEPTLIAGYKATELAAAPIKPPEPTKTEDKRATKNSTVRFLMGLGVVLFLLGVVLTLTFNAIFGVIVAFLGAAAVIIGVFAPLK